MSFFGKTIKGAFTVVLCIVAVVVVALIAIVITANLAPSPDRSVVEVVSAPEPEPEPKPEPEPVPEQAQETTQENEVTPEDTEEQAAPETNQPTEKEPEPETETTPDQSTPTDNTSPPTETVTPAGNVQSAIDSIAEKHGAVGVQVAVINNGEITGTYNYGYATRGTAPMTSDTKIRIASLSKVILAMVVMRLVELAELDIDTDIGEYWGADIRNPNHKDTPITMRYILSHTSSIRVYDYGFAAGGELIRSRFLDGSCFVRSTPGVIGSWNYNNYAFASLGITVEVAMDETVNSLAKRLLFAPLGIDAAFGSGSITGTDKLATLYTNGGGIGRSVETQLRTLGSTYPGESGEEFPGGLTISAYDYAKLMAVLANSGGYGGVRVLSPESVAVMESSQGRTGGFDQCLPMRRRTNLFGEEVIFYHTGSNFGVFSLASYNPINRNGVVVLTTGAPGTRDSNDIYAICSEISESVYAGIRD